MGEIFNKKRLFIITGIILVAVCIKLFQDDLYMCDNERVKTVIEQALVHKNPGATNFQFSEIKETRMDKDTRECIASVNWRAGEYKESTEVKYDIYWLNKFRSQYGIRIKNH